MFLGPLYDLPEERSGGKSFGAFFGPGIRTSITSKHRMSRPERTRCSADMRPLFVCLAHVRIKQITIKQQSELVRLVWVWHYTPSFSPRPSQGYFASSKRCVMFSYKKLHESLAELKHNTSLCNKSLVQL